MFVEIFRIGIDFVLKDSVPNQQLLQMSLIPFPEFLQQLAQTHDNLVLMLNESKSGHAELYQKMVERVCQELNPSPVFLHYAPQTVLFKPPASATRGSPIIYYLRDGQLKGVIEGILAYHHFLNRIQLLNQ